MAKRKQRHWQDFGNVLAEAKRVMEETGAETLPAHDELIKQGYSSLAGAMNKYFAISKVRTALGQKGRKRADSYWNPTTIEEEARVFMQEQKIAYFPSKSKLVELERYDLLSAIHKHYPGQYTALRERLGADPQERKNGHWTSEENILAECRKVLKKHKLKRLPNGDALRKLGHGDLAKGIQNHHGATRIRTLLGENAVQQKKMGYWQDPQNIIRETRAFMDAKGLQELPSLASMNNGYSSLRNAIGKYPGGIEVFQRDLGRGVVVRTSQGYWKDRSNLLKEIDDMFQTHNLTDLPPYQKINELGRKDIVRAIVKYHGGFGKFRKAIGQQELQKPFGYWTTEVIFEELERLKKEHKLEEITYTALEDLGEKTLLAAISVRGGLTKILKDAGVEVSWTERGAWMDLNYALDRAKEVLEEHKWEKLPGNGTLTEHGYSNLSNAISKYHGGFHKFRTALGQQPVRIADGLLSDASYVMSNCIAFMQQHGYEQLPSQAAFSQHKQSSLGSAISRHHGGFAAFRKRIDEALGRQTEENTLERLLADYVGAKRRRSV